MSVLREAKQQIIKELKQTLGKEVILSVDNLEAPPDPTLGDVAFPCFVLAKSLKRNPNEIAIEIAANIAPKEFVKQVKADGPYVNFVLSEEVFGSAVFEEIHDFGSKYGSSEIGKGKSIMVEYAQPNTHKQIHVGHLRNFLVGRMAVDTLKTNGYEVIPTSYINDLGTHVAKSVWAMKKFHEGEEVEKEKRIAFLGKVYVEATEKSQKDKLAQKEISEMFQQLESLKGEGLSIWKKTRKWSIDYFKRIFKELGLPIDAWYFESDLIDETKKIIDELIKKNIVVKSEGAYIVDLEEEKLGVNLLVKSDGTLLYNAKDIALALQKEREYHPMRSLYVIDARQSLAMQQLFATLKKMGVEKELEHLSYEFVTTKGGAMASRKGNVILYDDFRDQMVEMAKKETKKRHEDWEEKQLDQTARAIAFAAIRFGMLKQDLDKKIVFDMEEALSFDGFTGPYLLYTYARMQGILRKAKKIKIVRSAAQAKTPVEHQLLLEIARYPEIIFEIGQSMHLASLAQYLFGLSKLFSEYYHEVPVLNAEDELVPERLAMVEAVSQVLENGLTLLGIESIEEM